MAKVKLSSEIIIQKEWLVSCVKREMSRGTFSPDISKVAVRKDKAIISWQELLEIVQDKRTNSITLV